MNVKSCSEEIWILLFTRSKRAEFWQVRRNSEKKKFVKNTLIPEYKRKRLYLNIKGKACTGIKGGNTEF